MKAGIAVDNWKLPVFLKRLNDAGFDYRDGGPMPGDTTLLTVETNDVLRLQSVIQGAQAECAKSKR